MLSFQCRGQGVGQLRNTLSPSSFRKHEASPSHMLALQRMRASFGDKSEEQQVGQFTGVSDSVPRIDKFFIAGLVISRHDTFSDYSAYIQSLRLVSHLPTGDQAGDLSHQTCAKLVISMSRPLYDHDVSVLRKSTVGSIAFDVRDDLMMVIGRFFFEGLQSSHLPRVGVYEFLLGCQRVGGTGGARGSAASVERICKDACRVLHGRELRVDQDLWKHMQAIGLRSRLAQVHSLSMT